MKKAGRTVLRCHKWISNGRAVDSFRVVVDSQIKDIAKKNYESMGYTVAVG